MKLKFYFVAKDMRFVVNTKEKREKCRFVIFFH